MASCSLCGFLSEHFFRDKKREYRQCENCGLIFVPQKYHLSASQEKNEYDYHENDPLDPQYRKFLSQIIFPLEKYLTQGMTGLDFGSGPGPTLHILLQEKGFSMKFYDPFYAHYPSLLKTQYDFVTCTEVVEHFNDPEGSWNLLTGLVKKGGYLAVMTLFLNPDSKEKFSGWWYKNNETHIAFYSHRTLQWIEKAFSLHLIYSDDRIALFKKLKDGQCQTS